MENCRKIELLAPAKDKECAFAAVDCGADAVYMGCEKFGARSKAGNSIEDIKEVIEYAHKYRVKVYVTVNTLLDDKDIEEAQKTIHELYNIGADAIIIQDMGLLECDLPPIALHASTQCHNNTLEKVQFLEKVGLKRAVLARELNLQEIKNICSNTSIETECFIHGSLCVSYSGQCYMSYAIGGRSANKGECAQPCRKKFSLIDSKNKVIQENKHLLCLKDLNLSEHLLDLIEAGVTSFKIEGRLKDVTYIKNVVAFYRQKIDELIQNTFYQKSSSGTIFFDFEPDLNKTFNRDYTSYFISPKNKNVASFNTPKFIGEKIGKVKEIASNSFKLDKGQINNADGISFFDKDKELKGTQIIKSENGWVYPASMDSITNETIIFRNFDKDFTKKLFYAKPSRKISVKMLVEETENNMIFKIVDDENNEAVLIKENTYEAAQNLEKAEQNIVKQLSKLGETDYILSDIKILITKTPFIPISEINSLRRSLIEQLETKRAKNYRRETFSFVKNDEPYPESELYFNANILNKKAKEFYESHGSKILESAAENGLKMDTRKVMTTKHCLKYSFGLCSKDVGNKSEETLFLVDEKGKKYDLNFNCKDCIMEIYF
jgi:putative protease